MLRLGLKLATVVFILLSGTAVNSGAMGGDNTIGLKPGKYEITMRLELPHIRDANATRTVSICVDDGGSNAPKGLKVLSENNPLAKCPISDIASGSDYLSFQIICPGANSARGLAKYRLSEAHFSGRITMNMGGKNMTMTETQEGKRVGACLGGQGTLETQPDWN